MRSIQSKSLTAFSGATLAVYFTLILAPLLVVVVQSLRTEAGFSLDAYASVLSDERQWGLLANSLVIAAGSTGLATVLGAPLAFALGYLHVPTRGALVLALALPLLIPPYISAIAWIDAFGIAIPPPGNLGALDATRPNLFNVFGCIMVLGFAYYPVVAYSGCATLRRYAQRCDEPALLVMGRVSVLRTITLPLLTPALLSGALVVFILTLVEFSVPSLLQVNVYAVEVFTRFSLSFNPAEAMAQALPLVVLGVATVALWAACAAHHRGRLTGQPGASPPRSGRVAWLWAVVCWGVVGATALLPLALLVRRSLPLSSYVEVWQTAKEELVTSLVVAVASASTLVGLCAAMVLLTRYRRPSSVVYKVAGAAYLVSGPLLAVGLIVLWNHAGVAAVVYDTMLILIIATMARYACFVYQVMVAALRDVPQRYEEAASACGLPWRRSARTVLAPLVYPALVAAWGLGFVLAMRELDAAVLLAPPGRSTLAVRMFGLMHYGPGRLVAALSLVSVVLILVGAGASALLYAGLRRSARGRH